MKDNSNGRSRQGSKRIILYLFVLALAVAAFMLAIVVGDWLLLRDKFFDALWREDFAEMRKLIEQGANVDMRTFDGRETPLHLAAMNGPASCVKFLIGVGADVNAQTASGATPLHAAVYGGHEDIVSFLLEAGADVNLRTKGGETALHVAITPLDPASYEPEDLAIVEMLLDEGVEINAQERHGNTALKQLRVLSTPRKSPSGVQIEELLVSRGATE